MLVVYTYTSTQVRAHTDSGDSKESKTAVNLEQGHILLRKLYYK